MKIISLIGSLRKDSYNRRIFEYYQSMISSEAEVVEGKLDDFPLYNDDIRENGTPESVLRLADQIRSANGVIFFSPEYNYSVPAPLKNAIDWLSKIPKQPFAAKSVTIVSASPGRIGGARMHYHLRQIGVFLDMRFLNTPEVMISEVHKKVNAQGELTDVETQKFLKTHYDSFVKFCS